MGYPNQLPRQGDNIFRVLPSDRVIHFDSIGLMEPEEGTKRAKSGRKPLPVEQKKTVRAILLKPDEWRWIERFGINPSQQISTLIARTKKQDTIALSSANLEAFPRGN